MERQLVAVAAAVARKDTAFQQRMCAVLPCREAKRSGHPRDSPEMWPYIIAVLAPTTRSSC